MMKKKVYIAPVLEHLNLDIPSILAGTTHGPETEVYEGGTTGDGEEGLARRHRGFWDDEDF